MGHIEQVSHDLDGIALSSPSSHLFEGFTKLQVMDGFRVPIDSHRVVEARQVSSMVHLVPVDSFEESILLDELHSAVDVA